MPSFSLFQLQDKHGLKKLVLRASTCKKEEIIEIIKKVMWNNQWDKWIKEE